MWIVPFIYKKIRINHVTITTFQILTVGGKELWLEDDSLDIHDILTPNGIYMDGAPIQFENTFLCQVNTVKTNISDFYKWEEIKIEDSDTFCWRTFYTFGETDNYTSWLPIPLHESIGKYSCKELLHIIQEHRHR